MFQELQSFWRLKSFAALFSEGDLQCNEDLMIALSSAVNNKLHSDVSFLSADGKPVYAHRYLIENYLLSENEVCACKQLNFSLGFFIHRTVLEIRCPSLLGHCTGTNSVQLPFSYNILLVYLQYIYTGSLSVDLCNAGKFTCRTAISTIINRL